MHDKTITNPTDEAAVCALYQELMDGCNQGSGTAFATVLPEDGDLVAFDGTHSKGGEEIAPFHQEPFDKWLKGSRFVGASPASSAATVTEEKGLLQSESLRRRYTGGT